MRTLMGMERDKIKYWKNNLFFIHNAIPSSMLHFQFIHYSYNNKSKQAIVIKAKMNIRFESKSQIFSRIWKDDDFP